MTVRAVSNNPASPFYNSSAPNLTGQVGSLTALLDAVLVTGFTSFTALGWTIGQTTTNKRQYVMAAGGTGNSLWVDDTAVTTAKEARCSGYATMSATTPTGTGQFPTSAQSSIGTGMLVIRKSTTADSTVRYWTIIGDGNTFYLFTETGDYTGPTAAFSFTFGDFFTYGPSDTSNCIIIGRQIENNAQVTVANGATIYEGFPQLNIPLSASFLSNTLNGHYVAASFTNVGGSLAVGKHTDQTKMALGTTSLSGMQMGYLGSWVANSGNSTWINEFIYPNGPDAGLYQAPVWIHHNGNVRGYLKGLWAPLQHLPLNHNDTFSGSGNLAGKSLLAQACCGVTTNNGVSAAAQVFIETSNTWS